MKNNRNNRDKLNDALGMVDEELLQDAMLHVEGMGAAHLSRRAVMRRRVAITAAACLSLCMVVGAMLAVPLLTVDEPAQTQPPLTITTDTEEGELFYVEAPMVQVVQLSADEAAVISDPSIPSLAVDLELENESFRPVLVLAIDCRPGETVTLRAGSECLYGLPLEDETETEPETQSPSISLETMDENGYYINQVPVISLDNFLDRLNSFWCTATILEATDTLEYDPALSNVTILLPDSDEWWDEDVIEFTDKNENGEITGAGSIYVVRRTVIRMTENGQLTGGVDVTRSAVLGSVRFSNPSEVTEERVNELFEMLGAKVEACKETLDFTLTTKYELRHQAENAIDLFLADQPVLQQYSENNSKWNYSLYSIEMTNGSWRRFIIFSDGAWAEFQLRNHNDCDFPNDCHGAHDCPNSDEYGCHFVEPGCVLKLKDGRIVTIERATDENGQGIVKAVVSDPTE